jgi:hypothetical protein
MSRIRIILISLQVLTLVLGPQTSLAQSMDDLVTSTNRIQDLRQKNQMVEAIKESRHLLEMVDALDRQNKDKTSAFNKASASNFVLNLWIEAKKIDAETEALADTTRTTMLQAVGPDDANYAYVLDSLVALSVLKRNFQ